MLGSSALPGGSCAGIEAAKSNVVDNYYQLSRCL